MGMPRHRRAAGWPKLGVWAGLEATNGPNRPISTQYAQIRVKCPKLKFEIIAQRHPRAGAMLPGIRWVFVGAVGPWVGQISAIWTSLRFFECKVNGGDIFRPWPPQLRAPCLGGLYEARARGRGAQKIVHDCLLVGEIIFGVI